MTPAHAKSGVTDAGLTLLVALGLALFTAAFLGAGASGCGCTPKPPHVGGTGAGGIDAGPIGVCPAASTVTGADVCDQLFTTDGHACFVCPDYAGCLDPGTQVYCVTTGCLSDLRCLVLGKN